MCLWEQFTYMESHNIRPVVVGVWVPPVVAFVLLGDTRCRCATCGWWTWGVSASAPLMNDAAGNTWCRSWWGPVFSIRCISRRGSSLCFPSCMADLVIQWLASGNYQTVFHSHRGLWGPHFLQILGHTCSVRRAVSILVECCPLKFWFASQWLRKLSVLLCWAFFREVSSQALCSFLSWGFCFHHFHILKL